MTRVIDALSHAEAEIGLRGSRDARLEAEVLLCHLLGIDKAKLYADLQQSLPDSTCDSLSSLVERRPREPLAYLTNYKEFYGRDFYVDRRVLVPRPETETLVEQVLHLVGKKPRDVQSPLRIADVGTGSGIIAVTLSLALPDASVYAIDISSEALEVAAINCARHGVSDRVRLLHGDLLEPLPGKVDVIVANLPYVTDIELARAEADWSTAPLGSEPAIALNGGRDGLDVISRLISTASIHLTPGGAMILEIGSSQGDQVLRLAQRHFGAAKHFICQDLAGLDRVLVVSLQ